MLRFLALKIQKSTLYVQTLLMLVLATFVCTAVVSYVFVNKGELKHWQIEAQSTLAEIATKIEYDLLEPQSTLSNISQLMKNMILSGYDEETVLKIITDIEKNTADDAVRQFRVNGAYGSFEKEEKFFCTNWTPYDGYNMQERIWYKAAVEANGKMGVTKPYKSLRGAGTVISYTRRIFDDEENPLFIVSMDASMDRIIEYVSNMHFTEHSYGILLNENMEFVAHPSSYLL
ncbi:MAG: cache domain-containing protein, partial [Fibromonadaceae bacterium]|nr:cache domain-containing protein [Fibromonadaceae bacterium]